MSKSTRRPNADDALMTTVARAAKRTVMLSRVNRKERKSGVNTLRRMREEELTGTY